MAFIHRSMVQNKLELLGQAGISGHTFKEADTKFMAVSKSHVTLTFVQIIFFISIDIPRILARNQSPHS